MDRIATREIVKSLLTQVPMLNRVLPRQGAGGGTRSAEYCYGVWMKHMAMLMSHGAEKVPASVAELGPGDSLGVGFAMLLSGSKQYSAFDVVPHASDENLSHALLDQLHVLFSQKAARPQKGWPDFDERLDTSLFPSSFLSDEVLAETLTVERLDILRKAISAIDHADVDSAIRYVAPWTTADSVQPNSMDLVYSHSVLEYMDDLEACYRSQWEWIRPGGYISHQIDLTGHSLSVEWDGFRGYGELTWKLMLGKRPFSLNRQPYSAHINAIKAAGFDITVELRREVKPKTKPASRWKNLSTEDLSTSGLFVQARKPITS